VNESNEEMGERPLVFSSIVDDAVRSEINKAEGLVLDVFERFIVPLEAELGLKSTHAVGKSHSAGNAKDYNHRIEAINYTLAHDDGVTHRGLEEADIVLVGVSRTSKTPTCVYLANRGVRAANVPLVPLVDPPAELESAKRPLIVGLITDPERLVQIRVNRLRLLQQDTESEYTDMERVQLEIQNARRLYARRKWATIDVTRRSIEETAASILQMLATRREQRLQAG
jgi:regulator of PEP synthase PpsR (kinase-PPPase family)